MSQAGSITGFNSIRIENALVPDEGPKIVPINLEFGAIASYEIDLTLSISQRKIRIVQGIYIDNSQNSNPFTIEAQASKQRITVQPGAQGYYPLLAGQFPRFTCSSNGTALVYIAFLNVPVPALQWNTGLGASIGVVDQGAAGTQAWPIRIENATGDIDATNPLIIAPVDPVITGTTTIAAAANVSGFIAINEGYTLATLFPPAAWTAASLWIQGSYDGVNAFNLNDANGNNIVIPFDAVYGVAIPPALLTGLPFIRLQSVDTATPTTPVAQAADRVIGYSIARIV